MANTNLHNCISSSNEYSNPHPIHREAGWVSLFYTYGANKNVSEMVYRTIENGIGAHYEYSPFGETVVSTRNTSLINTDICTENPFRFSSEYHDDALGLIYYNYRHYNPEIGRWLSRDPIEEKGGNNLYGMIKNNPINYWDVLGLSKLSDMDLGIAGDSNDGDESSDDCIKNFKRVKQFGHKINVLQHIDLISIEHPGDNPGQTRKSYNLFELTTYADYSCDECGNISGVNIYTGNEKKPEDHISALNDREIIFNYQFDKVITTNGSEAKYTYKVGFYGIDKLSYYNKAEYELQEYFRGSFTTMPLNWWFLEEKRLGTLKCAKSE